MTGLDIEAIRERALAVAKLPVEWLSYIDDNARVLAASAGDVMSLLDEVKQLRGWNSEVVVERDRLSAERLEAESSVRIAQNALHAERRAHLETAAERDDARAALADALQVLADLRGELEVSAPPPVCEEPT